MYRLVRAGYSVMGLCGDLVFVYKNNAFSKEAKLTEKSPAGIRGKVDGCMGGWSKV